MTPITVVGRMSALMQAIRNCAASGNTEWHARHARALTDLVANAMPSGAGWDYGTALDARSTPERILLNGSFHHMDDSGSYDGWTDHTIVVTPAFDGITVRVTGRNRNQIKDYLTDLFTEALMAPYTE